MSLFNQGEKAYLLLADGTILEGIHFGVKGTATPAAPPPCAP